MFLRYLILKCFLVLANHLKWVQSTCSIHEEELTCRSITIEEYYVEYFKRMWRYDTTQITKIIILDGTIPRIEYVYNLPDMGVITSIKISGCGTKEVFEDDAFSDFSNLTVLDLSYNLLEEALFVEELPRTIIELILNNNLITYLDTDFSEWPSLSRLDLSHNMIKILKLDNFRNIFDVDISYNEVYNLPATVKRIPGYQSPSKLNLYHNDITIFYEENHNLVLDWLDLGANHLKLVNLNFNKRFIGFANAVVDQFYGEIETSVANLTNVQGLDYMNIVGKYILLKNSNLPEFGFGLFDIRKFYDFDYTLLDFLDLSNCSIEDIPDMYFSYLTHCLNLNLSYNSINAIYKTTFRNSKIDVLDLSNSKIEVLHSNCFTNNVMKKLLLNNNQISQFDKIIFLNTTVIKLDLSNNKIVEITENSFKNLQGTKYLNLSNNLIGKIHSRSISEIETLVLLDLTYNKFVNFDSNIFAYFPVKDLLLQGNNISNVEINAFDHLQNVKYLDLSGININTINQKAFANLSNVEEINLSNNNIKIVGADIFFETPNLKVVDLSRNPVVQIFKIKKTLALHELIISIDTVLEPDEIDNFYLKILTIKDSKLKVLKENTFQGLYTLRRLNFVNTTIDAVEPGAFNDLFRVQHLDTNLIFNNAITLPKDMFKDLVQLEKLDLSKIGLKTMEAGTFNGTESLFYLNLSHNKFVEIVNGTFDGLTNLLTLLLEFNEISNLVEQSFYGLDNLELLNLADNKLTSITKGAFNHLPHLNNLNLRNNQLKELGKDIFEGLVNLIELDISNNQLTVIPSGSLHYLKNLENLRLQYNSIAVLAVGCLAELKALVILDLSHNNLTTFNTKTSFLKSKQLLQLYLDHNDLSTLNIDELLKKCGSLKFVGISFNRFSCDDLATILLLLEEHYINFQSIDLIYDGDNINGITCGSKRVNDDNIDEKATATENNDKVEQQETAVMENSVKVEENRPTVTENNDNIKENDVVTIDDNDVLIKGESDSDSELVDTISKESSSIKNDDKVEELELTVSENNDEVEENELTVTENNYELTMIDDNDEDIKNNSESNTSNKPDVNSLLDDLLIRESSSIKSDDKVEELEPTVTDNNDKFEENEFTVTENNVNVGVEEIKSKPMNYNILPIEDNDALVEGSYMDLDSLLDDMAATDSTNNGSLREDVDFDFDDDNFKK